MDRSHSRSLSQPTFFGSNCLPPLSPVPLPNESSLTSPNLNLKSLSMEEIDASSATWLSSPRESHFRSNDGFPRPPRGHHRSNSDFPLGFSAMIQSSPQLVPISGQGSLIRVANSREDIGLGKSNVEIKMEGEAVDDMLDSFMDLDREDGLNSVADGKDKDGRNNGGDGCSSELGTAMKNRGSSTEGVKRSGGGDIVPQVRHYRSLSMDSSIGNFHFADSSTKLQQTLCDGAPQLSRGDSSNERLAKMNLDFGHSEFNELEMKKIMGDERLAEIAVSDPKRVKRILANRQSAARSKERKMHYISELEHKVKTLQTESTTLSAQIAVLQKDNTELTNQNHELKFRIQAMQQQAKLRDALHETLMAEVERLKVANMEFREDGGRSNEIEQQNVPTKHHLFPSHGQQSNMLVETSNTSTFV